MRRRDFLLVPLAPAAAQFLDASGDPLRSGPMLGYSEITETVVWLQTRRPSRVQIRFWPQGDPASARVSDEARTTEAGDLIARFTLSDLAFGTRYDYEVYVDGRRVARDYPTTFQTQAMWQYRSEPPPVRVAIGSCAFVNDALFDRPNDIYGRNMEIFRAIAAERPDAMLWLGDNVYFREPDFFSERTMRYRYAHTRSLADMQPLLASTHHYAIWDDHDFGTNDSDRTYRMRDTSLRIFKDYWANPTYGTSETAGVFGRFEWADVEFFLLDDRYHRTPNRHETDPRRAMFGGAQLEWLMAALASSRATFKFVAGGNQMLNPMTLYEAFGRFPAEQKRLFEFLRTAKVSGVVLLSGDRHHTELIRRTDITPYPLYDFTSSPLTSGTHRNDKEENNPARVAGTWVNDVRNFGMLEVSGPKDARRLTMRALDAAGKQLWRHEVAAADLRA
jgi:alkaline phosphatase D